MSTNDFRMFHMFWPYPVPGEYWYENGYQGIQSSRAVAIPLSKYAAALQFAISAMLLLFVNISVYMYWEI